MDPRDCYQWHGPPWMFLITASYCESNSKSSLYFFNTLSQYSLSILLENFKKLEVLFDAFRGHRKRILPWNDLIIIWLSLVDFWTNDQKIGSIKQNWSLSFCDFKLQVQKSHAILGWLNATQHREDFRLATLMTLIDWLGHPRFSIIITESNTATLINDINMQSCSEYFETSKVARKVWSTTNKIT